MNNYRTLQLTNKNIGAVAVGSNMPLGNITRKICCGNTGTRTFDVMTSGADTVVLNEKGYYNVKYNASVVAGADGILTLSIVANGTTVYTSSVTVLSTGSYNIDVPYQIRVFDNCASLATNNPMTIQILLGGVAITGGSSNLQIERMY